MCHHHTVTVSQRKDYLQTARKCFNEPRRPSSIWKPIYYPFQRFSLFPIYLWLDTFIFHSYLKTKPVRGNGSIGVPAAEGDNRQRGWLSEILHLTESIPPILDACQIRCG